MTENVRPSGAGSPLDSRRAELAETMALVDATEPMSPDHERFLDYLGALGGSLQALYDAGDGESDPTGWQKSPSSLSRL